MLFSTQAHTFTCSFLKSKMLKFIDNKWKIIDYKKQYHPEATTTFIKEKARESKQSPEYTIILKDLP